MSNKTPGQVAYEASDSAEWEDGNSDWNICDRAYQREWEAIAKAVLEWRPIKTAPKDGTEVLLFFPANKSRAADQQVGAWQHERWASYALDYKSPYPSLQNQHEQFYLNPTHWQPLPEAPN